MKRLSKRLINEKKNIDKKTQYNFEDAIKVVKDCASAKFNESIEAHISLNIDPKYANQQLRTSLVLPNGTGKELKIAVRDGFIQIESLQFPGKKKMNTAEFLNGIQFTADAKAY